MGKIRGVGSSRGTLDLLIEADWVVPKGRRQTPGRPATWGTTDTFLSHFHLNSLDDLPKPNELLDIGFLDDIPKDRDHEFELDNGADTKRE